MKPLRPIGAVLISAALASCASTLPLPQAAQVERDHMTPQQAEDLLQAYARPTARRGGLCLIGIRIIITQLDYNSLVKISGSIVNFDSYFARLAGATVQGNVAAGTGRVDVAYQASRQTASIDMRGLKEIRVLDSNANNLGKPCTGSGESRI